MNSEILAKIIIGGLAGGIFVLYEFVIKPHFKEKFRGKNVNQKNQVESEKVEISKPIISDFKKNKEDDDNKTMWQINALLWLIIACMANIAYIIISIKSQDYLLTALMIIPTAFLIKIIAKKCNVESEWLYKITDYIL
ncbi:MAG: hypothetical protein NTU43_02630, partial [Bacteroidetes bacterium]|nr:hypothetical protein [Bacteroidota bacterium]